MIIQIADIRIKLEGAADYTRTLCRDYEAEGEEFDFQVSVMDQEVEEMQEGAAEQSWEMAQSFAFLEKINRKMLDFDAFFLHAAVVALDGEAYAFTAKSGTGKSTHISKWMEVFGRKACIVNGDKPFFRKKDGVLYACGAPWCGKEGWQTNRMIPLKAISFLERSEENRIYPLSEEKVIDRIFRQVRLPKDPDGMEKFLNLMDWTITHIPFYVLECDISREAVWVAYKGMKGNEGI